MCWISRLRNRHLIFEDVMFADFTFDCCCNIPIIVWFCCLPIQLYDSTVRRRHSGLCEVSYPFAQQSLMIQQIVNTQVLIVIVISC